MRAEFGDVVGYTHVSFFRFTFKYLMQLFRHNNVSVSFFRHGINTGAYSYKKTTGSLYFLPSNPNRFNMERNGMIWSNKIANRRNRSALIKIFLTFCSQRVYHLAARKRIKENKKRAV